jgi:hypothetical protein
MPLTIDIATEARQYSGVIIYGDHKRAQELKLRIEIMSDKQMIKYLETLGELCTPRERHNLAQVLTMVSGWLSHHTRSIIQNLTKHWYTTPMLSIEENSH